MANLSAVSGNSSGDKIDPQPNIELGMGPLTPGGIPWGSNVDKNTSSVLNKPIVSVKQLTEMRRRDGQAKALFSLVTLPLRLALQTGEWVDPDEKGLTPEAKYATNMWNLPPNAGGMSTPKSKVIRQLLLGLTDGFSAFEIVRTVPATGPLKGMVTLRKLAYRDPTTLTFLVDNNGGYRGFRQITQLADMEPVDVVIKNTKSLVYTHGDEQNPYYGVSMFESAYPHWDAKRKLYYIAHLAAQFAAVPGRLGEIPDNAEIGQINEFRSALQEFAFNTSMLVPPGFKVTPFNGNSGYDFLKLIDHHNTQMSKSILASFFDTEQRTVLIENGADKAADADFFLLSMESIANDIAEVLSNHLIPQFIDMNFKSGRYPVFRPGELNDTTKDAIRDMFKTVVVSSVLNSTPEFVRELEKKVSTGLNLSIDYDEIAKQEKAAAEQQAAQQQAAPDDAGGPSAAQGEDGSTPPPSGGGNGSGDQQTADQSSGQGGAGPQEDTSQDQGGPAEVAASAMDIDAMVKAAQKLFLYDEASSVDDF